MADGFFLTLEEYNDIVERVRWLDCLEAAGLDNWDGVDYARELFNAG